MVTDATASVSITQVAKKTQGIVIYVVKTIETTGEWKFLTQTKLRLKICGLSHLMMPLPI